MLFRLSGDDNPLHIDPKVSSKVGFEKPIIHGLCTYGFVTKAVYDKYGNNEPELIKGTFGKFTSHVFPGETLVISMWK